MIQSGQSLSLAVETAEQAYLGSQLTRRDIVCHPGKFEVFPELKVRYPKVVLDSLGEIFREYNRAFHPIVEVARESSEDYQYCLDSQGRYRNYAVQIDMTGLPTSFLERAKEVSVDELQSVLRRCIFEIENSLAGYDLLQNLFPASDGASYFSKQFRAALAAIREQTSKPIALLAVTQEKYDLMLAYEFGMEPGQKVSPGAVQARTGFDAFFGPEEFHDYLQGNAGQCDYLLYVRASSPTSKLKNPLLTVDCPLLEDSEMRGVIKKNALTFNVDQPGISPELRLNDTKAYLRTMDLAFPITRGQTQEPLESILTEDFLRHLREQRPYNDFELGKRLTPDFAAFLSRQGVASDSVELGRRMLRFKPERESYGAYGHVRMALNDSRKKRDLRINLCRRGDYLVQPELCTPVLVDETTQSSYTYIDRNWFSMVGDEARFLGGYRTFMRTDAYEARHGRIHGSEQAIWAEILPEQ